MYYKTDGKPTIFAHSGFQEIVILFEIFHATLVLLFNCNHVRFHYNYVCIYVNSKYVLLILTYREVLDGFAGFSKIFNDSLQHYKCHI